MLKNGIVYKEICHIYTTLFNKSIKTGQLPKDWLSADITAIHKKGCKNDVGNYRPVSLMCIIVICKILETFVREHVMMHLKINKLLSNREFGFIKGRSTVYCNY